MLFLEDAMEAKLTVLIQELALKSKELADKEDEAAHRRRGEERLKREQLDLLQVREKEAEERAGEERERQASI